MSNQKITVKKSTLISMFDKGMTREEMCTELNLNMQQFKALLKAAGMDKMRVKKVDFIFVDDTDVKEEAVKELNTLLEVNDSLPSKGEVLSSTSINNVENDLDQVTPDYLNNPLPTTL